MWITWLTYNDTFSSLVEYGINDLRWSAKGNSILFIDGGKQKSRRYIHRILLTDLIPGTVYRTSKIKLIQNIYCMDSLDT